MHCHGRVKKGARTCTRELAKDTVPEVERLLQEIVAAGRLEEAALQYLTELSNLVLCKRSHKDQATEKLEAWIHDLTPLSSKETDTTGSQSSDERKVKPSLSSASSSTTSRASQTADTKDESVKSRGEPSIKVDTRTRACSGCAEADIPSKSHPQGLRSSPNIPRRPNEGHVPAAEPKTTTPPQPDQPHTPPYTGGSDSDSSPPFQNTRSKQGKEVQRRPLNSHIFVSYAGQQTTREINDEIKKVLTQPLSKDEKKVDGFIYGYTFPESHTVKSLDSQTADPLNPGSYIKVGYTNEVGRRMKQVKRNCGYEPRHLFTPLQAPHYKRLERIIHRQLRNGRQREQACPSCGTGHLEWFRNEDGSAEKVIRMWRDWVAMRPYDEEGRLEDVWARRLHMVDLNSEDCWRDFVDLRVTLGPKLPRKSEKGIRPTPEAKRAGYPYLGGFIPVYAEAAAWYGNAHGSIPLGMYVPCRG